MADTDNKNKTDQDLIAEFRQGNEVAFDVLVERYTTSLYNFIYFFLGGSDEAADIVQESFYKIWKNFKKYDDKHNFKTWAMSIARNTAIDFLRKKKPLQFSSLEREDDDVRFEEKISDEEPLPHEVFEKKEIGELIEKVVKELPDHYRAVMLLRYNEDMSFEEISEALDKPLNTVKSQHRRALTLLRKKLEDPG